MSESTTDAGVIAALVRRFEEFRLPRALELKERVDGGATLTDADIEFLKRVFEDAQQIRPLADRHPEYHELVTRSLNLYQQITKKALENEQKDS